MNILLVTNMYPCKDAPTYGIFVKEQEEAICNEYPEVHYTTFFIDGRHKKSEYIKAIFQINKLIKRNNFDIIHIHYGLSGLFLLFNRIYKKIPVIVTLHGGDIQAEQGKKFQVWLTKKVLKRANIAITLNERMDLIVSKYIRDTQIIPCSVNTDVFIPPTKERTNKLEYNIIFPSDRKRYVKNYPLFEQTINILRDKYKIVCNTFEIKNMSRYDVAELYKNADLMIMTSISEGSPQVVKEAMATNLPVVSTNVGDVEILLYNVKDSAVAQSMSAVELADIAYKSLTNGIDGISGREKIYELQLDEKATAQKIYNIYSSLTNL